MFQIFVDSAANIPASVVEKYGIHVCVFVNMVNGKPVNGFEPGLSLDEERRRAHDYYEAVRKGAEIKTSLVNTADFIDSFTPVLKKGEDILYFSLSKNISGTYNAAKLAKEDLEESYPDRKILLVDSLNASLAQGILAIYGVIMRDQGVSIEECHRILTATVPKMNGMFTVGDLKYLAKTGRINAATALLGNALSIKPILRGNAEGFIVQFKKCRGRKKALNEVIDLVCSNIIEPEKQIIGIAQADAYEESCYVADEIMKRTPVKEIINTAYDYCTGSHVGPDTIALFYIANDRELMGRPDEKDYIVPEIFQYIH